MLDLKAIRGDPGPAREALARRGAVEQLDQLLEVDERRRELNTRTDEKRAAQKALSAEIEEAARGGGGDEAKASAPRERSAELKAELKRLEAELRELQTRQDELLARIPNPPSPDAPDGSTEEEAVELRRVGDPPELSFEPRDHLDLGVEHGWIEMEAAAEASGSRFAYL
ncbi:MAG: serine--tRNA ligase, partial [Solirubrobacterales bacterium]